ncbi:MAG: hypothetical protein QOI54_2481 [Actinomycetota bacterium]|jgi:hypothetical protein|nr:hypothetical protein [Actinomycetota bacterium]
MAQDDGDGADPPRPRLRVVRGEPAPEELAALLAVMAAHATGAPRPRPPRSPWNAPARLVRRPVHPRPGGWRRSALPD